MKYYRGDSNADFQVSEGMNSRYGFPAIFFTSSKKLAQNYAKHLTRNRLRTGSVYAFEYSQNRVKVDFQFKISHSAEFRNLIHTLKSRNIPSALIYNVIDYPSEQFKEYSVSDILVVFDLSIFKTNPLILEKC